MTDGEHRIRELDGWRAVSVTLVILAHLIEYHSPNLVQMKSLQHVFRYVGLLGVNVFFVISGFVICRLLIGEEARYGNVCLKGFYIRRIFRILPPFYVYVSVVCLLLAGGLIYETWSQIVIGVLFLMDVFPRHCFMGHTWSLAVEEQFYIIFPSLWVLTPRRLRGRVFLGLFVLCALWNISLALTGWKTVVAYEARTGFSCISAGVVIAIFEKRARRFAARIPAMIVVLTSCVLLLHPTPIDNWIDALYCSLFIPPAVGLLLVFSLERGMWLRAFLLARPVQAVGLTSYGIYLWQQLFTGPKGFYIGRGVVLWYVPWLLLVIVPLSYRFIEKPAMRYGKMLSRQARESSSSYAPVAS